MTLSFVEHKSKTPPQDKKLATRQDNTTPSQPFNLGEYFKGVKQEWHKITWPTREQVLAETGVVLVVVTIFSLFVFVADKIFQLIIQWIT